MIKENTTQLGPFPLGMDNVNNSKSRVFDQVGEQLPRLISATNVDIDNDGWIRKRPSIATLRSGTGILGGWNINGRFFIQEGSVLYERSGSVETSRVTGLSGRVSMCSHGDAIFITDGTTHKVLRGTNLYNWGLSIPVITVTQSSSVTSLRAGRYLVQASYTDSFGNEGPVSQLYAVTITANKGITVACTPHSDATKLNIYCSSADQTETNFVASVAVGSLPYSLTAFTSDADPCITHNMRGPIDGATGIFSFRSWLMMYRDNFIIRSEALEPHLFDGDNIFQFTSVINTVASLVQGFWVGAGDGLYWVADLPGLGSDQDTTGWVPFKRYDKKIFKGSKILHGSRIEALKTNEICALFASEDGLLVGMPDGSVNKLTDGRYEFNDSTRATIEYSGESDINKILVGLIN
jgi:hypothetical protein